MTAIHPPEIKIQQYVLDKSTCDEGTISHITGCSLCTFRAAQYEIILSGIKHLPEPAFDFNVEEAVLKQIGKEKPIPDSTGFTFYLPALLISACIFILVYLFRRQLSLLFDFSHPELTYLLVVSGVLVLLVLCKDMYNTFREKMHAMDNF